MELPVCFDNNKNLDICKADEVDSFSFFVDFDIDFLYHDGCHGSDNLYPDDPLKFDVTLYKDGFIGLETQIHSKYLFSPDGTVIQRYPGLNLNKANELPVIETAEKPVSMNDDIYKCYQDSDPMNRHLTEAQRKAVDSIFQSLKAALPELFSVSK